MFQLFHFWWPHSDSSPQCLGVSPEKGHEPDLLIMPVAILPPFPVLISLWSGLFTKTVFYTVAMTYVFLIFYPVIFTKCKNNICIFQEWMNAPPFFKSNLFCIFITILFWFVTACVMVFVFKSLFLAIHLIHTNQESQSVCNKLHSPALTIYS